MKTKPKLRRMVEELVKVDFNTETLEEVKNVPNEVHPDEWEGRVDLTDKLIFAIDSESTKDVDDAVSVEKLPNGNFKLLVAIADVSHYVTDGSSLDREAYSRGTSVYVADFVSPMLPPALSNNICSLNDGETRLALAAEMEIDRRGNVKSTNLFEAVVEVQQITYTMVNDFYKGRINGSYQEEKMLWDMKELHEILLEKRRKRGAIEFSSSELYVSTHDDGSAKGLSKRERGTGEMLIESFMLQANESVSKTVQELVNVSIYRVHDEPIDSKIERLAAISEQLGVTLNIKGDHITGKELQNFMNQIKGTPQETALSNFALRAMCQAKYGYENIGHFGIGAEAYSHFTSPIRRYPDLTLHRLIKDILKVTNHRPGYWEKRIPLIAEQSSKSERRAVDAEREIEKKLIAEYVYKNMLDKKYLGTIVNIKPNALIVELANGVKGGVNIATIENDFMGFDEFTYNMVGEQHGLTFNMGDKINIVVADADPDLGRIDFEYIPSTFDNYDKTFKRKLSQQKKGNGKKKKKGKRK